MSLLFFVAAVYVLVVLHSWDVMWLLVSFWLLMSFLMLFGGDVGVGVVVYC